MEADFQKNELSTNEQTTAPGFYLQGRDTLYSNSAEKIAKKLQENNPDLKIEYRGDLNEELERSLEAENSEERILRIQNVFSINLLELHNTNDDEEFKEKLETTKTLVNTLLSKNKESFFLLFNPEHEPSTILHSLNVMALSLYVSKEIARGGEIENGEDIALAALLHDMGKVKMRDIVQKKGWPDEDEWVRIKNHPKDGYDILFKAGVANPKILNAAKYHHRRFNGTGYPEIDNGEEVGNLTFFIGLIDSIEAITSRTRIHNQDKAVGMQKAFGILDQDMQKQPDLYNNIQYVLTKNALLAAK